MGGNSEGKTTLLEAVHLLSTIRSPLAETDADFIRWGAQDSPEPVARLIAEVERRADALKVEVVIIGSWNDDTLHARKLIRVNGLPRRASEAIGQLISVFFTANDIDLVQGPPNLRRRFLDITFSQIDKAYLRALQRYQKVLEQRNHLLRHIKEVRASADELDYWDNELTREGAYVIQARSRLIGELSASASQTYDTLAGGRERFTMLYKPQVGPELDGETIRQMDTQQIAEGLKAGLRAWQPRELGAGISLIGPHRDDLLFHLNDRPASAFASRAQQRSIALSLRLAEASYLWERSGDAPVLLLDDILSELDRSRRAAVLASIEPYEQVLMTATEVEPFSVAFLENAYLFSVNEGMVTPQQGLKASAG
jgi:DNA replication and repair protein RecF